MLCYFLIITLYTILCILANTANSGKTVIKNRTHQNIGNTPGGAQTKQVNKAMTGQSEFVRTWMTTAYSNASASHTVVHNRVVF